MLRSRSAAMRASRTVSPETPGSQFDEIWMTSMSSGRSERTRSIRSRTSSRFIFMSCAQLKKRPIRALFSSAEECMCSIPVTEPTASSSGRSTERSTVFGEAFG